ncbi:uncharacterized protein LOC120004315 [Tripterygium wilfordii]|uniref:uncharacterized protein LOC120004315 n=1 Tax=Tripterygium wilfordii TaxID=458696 RepID=UPI0018F820BE|nr:uncharacterized protein LOC120004315 [Tripterygium wilfordii]
MAVTCFSSPNILVQNCGSVVKPAYKTMMIKQGQVPMKKVSNTLVRSSFTNKVFEDRSEGIICYRDDDGEIVCEGYDEGPRSPLQISRTVHHSREAELVNLLQERWFQIVNGGDSVLLASIDDLQMQENLKLNGFNKLWHQFYCKTRLVKTSRH